MNFIDLFVFISVSVGITSGIVVSSLLTRFRDFISNRSDFIGELIHCPMCTGFWVGVPLAVLFNINPIYGGFMSSVFSWIIIQTIDSIIRVGEYHSVGDESGE